MAPLQAGAPEPQGDGVVLLRLGEGECLFEALRRLDDDASVRAVVVAGQGEDSWALEEASEGEAAALGRLAELRRAHMPVIACIGGHCRGVGLSLALACDLRFAAQGAELLSRPSRSAVASGDASTHVLPQLVGPGNAIVGLLAGDDRPAEQLPGLVQRALPKETLLAETLAFARRVAAAAPTAVAVTKQQVYGLPRRSLPEAQAIGARLAETSSGEREEADAAASARRAPSFGDYSGAQPLAALARELLAPGAVAPETPEALAQEADEPWVPGSGPLLMDWHEHGVVQLTLNARDRANAWGPDIDLELFKALNYLESEAHVRAVVVTGYDQEFAREGSDAAVGEAKRGWVRRFSDIRNMHVPVIACINGTCRGPGFSLALACDLRFAASGAEISAGFAQRGRVAEDEAAHMLPQLVGAGGAQLLLLGGEPLAAEQAPKGFVQRLCKPEDVLRESLDFAKKLAVFSSPNSMAVIKWQTYRLPMRNFDEAHWTSSQCAHASLFDANPDHGEGMRAFGTGQPPSFGSFHWEIPFVRTADHLLKMPVGAPAPYQAYPELPKPPKDGMEYQCVLVEELEDGVVVITLNKRTRMNAWGPDIDQEFFEVLDYYDSDPSTRVIVVTGQGFFFCAGHDAEFTQDGDSLHTGTRPKVGAVRDFHDIRKMRTPTIACVNGAACGIGLSLALVCDIRFAAADAKFGVIFPQRGLIGEESTAYILPHSVGTGDALMLLLTGENIPAQDLPAGVVQRTYPRKELLPQTLAFAKALARSGSPAAMAVVKQQALQLPIRPFDDALEVAGRLAACSREEENPDRAEAASALADGRSPQFRNYDESLPFLRLARELLGGMTQRPWPPPKPRPRPEPKAAAKAPAPKPEPKPEPKPRPAPKAAAGGPQLAVRSFTVAARSGAVVRKHAAEDAPELSRLDEGDSVYVQEETFDGWAKLAEEEGFVRRHALVDGSPTAYLQPEAGEELLLAAPEPVAKPGPRKFKVSLKAGLAVKTEPRAKAKVQSQKKCGEIIIAEAQTYDGWVRLVRNQGWALAMGASVGRMLEPLAA